LSKTLNHAAVAAAPMLFVFLWSTGFIGAKYGLPYAEPFTFLAARMGFVVVLHLLVVWIAQVPLPTLTQAGHSVVTGLLVHGLYLGGVFVAISQGVPAGISALIPGLQPILTSTLANWWLGEKVGRAQWLGLALGLIGVALVLHDRALIGSGTAIGWTGSVASLLGIALGTLYQKRHGSAIDWRSGNLVQYAAAATVFAVLAFAFETRAIQWTAHFVFALSWLVLVLSFGAVGLMYWLIRHSAATGFASLFYLVPVVTALLAYLLFGETLDKVAIAGMAICATGVFLVNRSGGRLRRAGAAHGDG
jgi:drug/metabolite transporter (DMT)-like permease